MIYSSVDFVDFKNAFRRHGRMDNFPNTLEALFDYLDELSNELEGGLELDVISICCEFSEYSLDELKREYSHLLDPESEDFIEDLQYEINIINTSACDNGYFLVQGGHS